MERRSWILYVACHCPQSEAGYHKSRIPLLYVLILAAGKIEV